jgi:lysophospholipase L1-like esterase
VHNVITTKGPVNARSSEQIVRQANGVHPDSTGYRQLADSIYCWMKGTLAK